MGRIPQQDKEVHPWGLLKDAKGSWRTERPRRLGTKEFSRGHQDKIASILRHQRSDKPW